MNVIERYISQNSGSRVAYEKAKLVHPSGNTRSALYWPPFPLCMRKGNASKIWDIDGNKRIDFNFNNTTLILGHNHPKVFKSIVDQLSRSTVLGTPTEAEPKLAEEIIDRLSSADLVRFTPSSTETNMQEVRVARAYKNKPLLAKYIGEYHGSWDAVPLTKEAIGIPTSVKENTIYFPYNDIEAAENLIKKHHRDLAAVIIEPTMRDLVPKQGYLESLREITKKFDVLLIFDEVISFRLSPSGAQGLYGVIPDITTMGKIIGGGFPVGAYASTEEVFNPLLIPEKSFEETKYPALGFSGTFNAHPISMMAGLTVMNEMKPDVYERMNKMGESMRDGLKRILQEEKISAYVGGIGSFFWISWTDVDVYDHATSLTSDRVLFNYFNIGMMNEGCFILGHPNVSAIQTKEDIETGLNAAKKTIAKMKPIIKRRKPSILT